MDTYERKVDELLEIGNGFVEYWQESFALKAAVENAKHWLKSVRTDIDSYAKELVKISKDYNGPEVAYYARVGQLGKELKKVVDRVRTKEQKAEVLRKSLNCYKQLRNLR